MYSKQQRQPFKAAFVLLLTYSIKMYKTISLQF